MTTELLEYEHEFTTEADLPRPESAPPREAARRWSWSTNTSLPSVARSASPSRDIDRAVGISDAVLWDRLRHALAGHHGAEAVAALVASRWLEAGHEPFAAAPAPRSSAEDMRLAARRRRYARLLKRLDDWAADTSGFDERVAPLIEEALRETAPRHFPDE